MGEWGKKLRVAADQKHAYEEAEALAETVSERAEYEKQVVMA